MEFCHRLSRHAGQTYILPSEAQWEVACRADTITPFAYGTTITTDLANFNGTGVYADEAKGIHRRETSVAGSFPANKWGLQDMHGNVWELYRNNWHHSYQGSPSDGSSWPGVLD